MINKKTSRWITNTILATLCMHVVILFSYGIYIKSSQMVLIAVTLLYISLACAFGLIVMNWHDILIKSHLLKTALRKRQACPVFPNARFCTCQDKLLEKLEKSEYTMETHDSYYYQSTKANGAMTEIK